MIGDGGDGGDNDDDDDEGDEYDDAVDDDSILLPASISVFLLVLLLPSHSFLINTFSIANSH